MACTTFVAVRGYKCVTKYLTEPQSNRISYRFNSGVAFPAITFCPFDEPGFKISELDKCQLTQDDYFTAGQWIGKNNNSNCSDPKILYNTLIPKIEDLNIKWVRFKTFKRTLKLNSTQAIELLHWNKIYLESMICFELTIPDDIRNEGISEFKIRADYFKTFLYQKGWLSAETPELTFTDTSYLVVSYEILNLLDYDNKPCMEDESYRNYVCKHEFIHKVPAQKFQFLLTYYTKIFNPDCIACLRSWKSVLNSRKQI